MTEMTARVRNRLQDGMINWQEKRFRKEDFRQQQADIHRSRMTCSASLPSFHQSQDWTGGIAVCESRKPVIEDTKPMRRVLSSEGVRWDAALAALILAGVLLLAFLLADVAAIGSTGHSVNKLNANIETLAADNERIRGQIEQGSSSANVCTEAVKMNLISSKGARTIRLTVPVNAQMTLSTAAQAAQNAELQMRMTAYAGD